MSTAFPDLGPHAGFIWAAYAITALVVGGLTIWIIATDRRQRRLLARLEAGGARRRSAGRDALPPSGAVPEAPRS